MKKMVSLILVLAIVLSVGITALAATADLSVDKTKLKKGDTVNVELNLSEAMADVTNFEYSLYFDPDRFELHSAEKGAACSLTQISNLKTDAKGSFYSISFVDTTSEGITVNAGTIYTLTFKAVKDATEAETSDFELKQVSVMDTSWSQVSSAAVGTAKISLEIVSDEEEPEAPGAFKEITLTVAAPANVEKTAGTDFNAIIFSTEWDAQAYKLLDAIVTVPAGLDVTSVTAGNRLSGGSVYYYMDSENNLRIVYYNNTYSDISLIGTDFPAQVFTIGLKTTENLTAESGIIALSGASLKLNSDSESESSMNVLKIGETADEQGNTGSTEVAFTEPAVITVTAAELFVGDGIDIIPADKKGIVVCVSGLSDKNVKLTYQSGEAKTELLFAPDVTEMVGNLCYVAVVDTDESVEDYANWTNYTADAAKAADEVSFGDTNGDGVVNAQDALNVVNVWLRAKEIAEENDYLIYNVNSDARINTFDALGVEEAFVNSTAYKIVTRAAALTSKR